MKKRARYVLKKDLIIPAGTVFECVDGTTRRFASGNFEAVIGLSRDSSGSLVYGVEPNDAECMEWFEVQPTMPLGASTIKAVRFDENPSPDKVSE